jgi:hypothetical protein
VAASGGVAAQRGLTLRRSDVAPETASGALSADPLE